MSVERSTIRSPSSLSQVRSQGSGLGAGPSIFSPRSALELAAVARAGDDAQLRIPRGQAAEVRANRAEREIAFLGVNQIDARLMSMVTEFTG